MPVRQSSQCIAVSHSVRGRERAGGEQVELHVDAMRLALRHEPVESPQRLGVQLRGAGPPRGRAEQPGPVLGPRHLLEVRAVDTHQVHAELRQPIGDTPRVVHCLSHGEPAGHVHCVEPHALPAAVHEVARLADANESVAVDARALAAHVFRRMGSVGQIACHVAQGPARGRAIAVGRDLEGLPVRGRRLVGGQCHRVEIRGVVAAVDEHQLVLAFVIGRAEGHTGAREPSSEAGVDVR